jgi:SAM-dependent methyltransferase
LPKDKTARILDIGCGMGHFLSFLKEKGYTNFEGIDIGREQVEFCHRYVTERVTQIESIPGYLNSRKNLFDLVTMNDVIEHIPKSQIAAVLESVYSSLTDKGILIIKTGNVSPIFGLYMRYIDLTHEVAFTENSLRQILLTSGFRNIEIFPNRINWSFNPRRFLWLLAQKVWFFILSAIYLIEVGKDRPRILSKLLIAVARK